MINYKTDRDYILIEIKTVPSNRYFCASDGLIIKTEKARIRHNINPIICIVIIKFIMQPRTNILFPVFQHD